MYCNKCLANLVISFPEKNLRNKPTNKNMRQPIKKELVIFARVGVLIYFFIFFVSDRQ